MLTWNHSKILSLSTSTASGLETSVFQSSSQRFHERYSSPSFSMNLSSSRCSSRDSEWVNRPESNVEDAVRPPFPSAPDCLTARAWH